jgi:hypothetical protein
LRGTRALILCLAAILAAGGASGGPAPVLAGRTALAVQRVTSGTQVVLESVSCVSTSDCMAVGYSGPPAGTVPVAELWNGREWEDLAVPDPGLAGLHAVSCVTATFCMAVGEQDGGNCYLAESFDGRSWAVVPSNQPGYSCGGHPGSGTYYEELDGVSCTAPTACMAVGADEQNQIGLFGFAIVAAWNGKDWSVATAPVPAGAETSGLSGVACPSGSACVAGGTYFSPSAANYEPLVDAWNGARWSVVTGADVAAGGVLNGVSCTGSSFCVAVGRTEDSGSILAEVWNGRTLAVMRGTAGSGDSGTLDAVSCTAPDACLAVGTTDAFWNASTWTRAGARAAGMDGTWCASPTWCVAVGSPALPAFWNGSQWTATPPAPVVAIVATADGHGYYLVAADGTVQARGDAELYGDMAGRSLNGPIVGLAIDPATGGYWLVGRDGGVFSFHAPFFGSAARLHLAAPVVGIAAAPQGTGYRLAGADGGVFDYGPGAHFSGSMGGKHLNRPVVGIAWDGSTGGYWLVAADGGVFSFRARFLGSAGGLHLAAPVVGIDAAAPGSGYRLVASDGGVFDFGAARFSGCLSGKALTSAVSGLAAGPTPTGYWLAQADGAVVAFGGA